MARAPKAKPLAHVAVTRTGSTYQIQVEDEAGKKALFELTSDLTLRLADKLDDLLADEEDEMRPPPAAPAPRPEPRKGSGAPSAVAQDEEPEDPPVPAREGSGTVKWYNATKGFGFITPDEGGEEVFLHRTVLEQAGLTGVTEGMRVRIGIVDGKKGPQVSRIELA